MKSANTKTFHLLISLVLTALLFISCKEQAKKENEETVSEQTEEKTPFFKLSLAQWSFHKAITDEKTLDPIDFAQKAKEMGFEGLEYVNHLYAPYLEKGDDPEVAMQNLLDTLKMKSEKYEMRNLIIMVDGEGDLASPKEEERNTAVDNHKKWVDAAAYLGCHSIRVNLFGSDEADSWVENSIKGLKGLAEYAQGKNINIIVENHGGYSSDAGLLTKVIEGTGMDNTGTLPDFGNFCLKREGGERWGAPCVEEYDKYKGVEILMNHAKAVSAKSYDFDETGNETTIDYGKMLQIVKDAGYTGFVGVEYEGSRLSEEEGVKATRDLLIQLAKQ